jgi:hypothetical protein
MVQRAWHDPNNAVSGSHACQIEEGIDALVVFTSNLKTFVVFAIESGFL